MKAIYQSGNSYLIKISDNKYYYGDGDTRNNFEENPVQFLRFNPYMKDVSEENVTIPQKIVEFIKKQSNTKH
jgi:hypothetical protein